MNAPRLAFALAALVALATGCNTTSPRDVVMADAHRDYADAKLAVGEPEVAIKEYQSALKLHPNDVESHYGLAEAFRRKGMLVENERELREVLRLQPDHHEARLSLGVTFLSQERWADAAAEFTTLAEDPTFVRPTRALVNLGWAHFKAGDLERAKADFERALRADHSNYVAHLDLGIVLYEKGELVESIQCFEEAVKIIGQRPVKVFGPAEAEARYRMAQAYLRLGQRDRALDTLRVAVERGGESEWGRKSVDYLKVLQ